MLNRDDLRNLKPAIFLLVDLGKLSENAAKEIIDVLEHKINGHEPMMKLATVAKLLDISPRTLMRMYERGEIAMSRPGGGDFRISQSTYRYLAQPVEADQT